LVLRNHLFSQNSENEEESLSRATRRLKDRTRVRHSGLVNSVLVFKTDLVKYASISVSILRITTRFLVLTLASLPLIVQLATFVCIRESPRPSREIQALRPPQPALSRALTHQLSGSVRLSLFIHDSTLSLALGAHVRSRRAERLSSRFSALNNYLSKFGCTTVR